jgi:N-methylhydantoinase A
MDEDVQVVSVRATSSVALGAAGGSGSRVSAAPEAVTPGPVRSVEAYSFAAAEWRSFPTVDRSALGRDTPIVGPMLIPEETTTTYVDVGFTGRVHPSGALMLTSGAVE